MSSIVNVTAQNSTLAEGGDNSSIIFNLSQPAPVGGLAISFDLAGSTATLGEDFSFDLATSTNITALGENSLVIAEGESTATLAITTISDAELEPAESISFNLLESPGAILGNDAARFLELASVPSGDGATASAVGDLNGDGNLDIVVTNAFANNASVSLGNGDGTFTQTAVIAAEDNAASVVLGDVNNDGVIDIVVGNENSDTATLAIGNGDGSFLPSTTLDVVGNGPRALLLEDVDGDGNLDLLAANENNDNITTALGNGDGTFGPAIATAGLDFPQSLALEDLDGDDNLDAVVANLSSDDVSVLLGNGDGSFDFSTSVAVGDGPRFVVLGDVNEDGNPDILTANQDGDNVSLALGNGDGSFNPSTLIEIGGAEFANGEDPEAIALADINGDGQLDILTANSASDDISVLLGNGDGSFESPVILEIGGNNPQSIVLADVDNDGDADILTANIFSDDASVLLNQPGVDFTIAADNAPPTLTTGGLLATEGDGPATIDLQTLAADADGDDITFEIVGDAIARGSVSLEGSVLTFDPGDGFQDLGAGETEAVIVQVQATDSEGAQSDIADVIIAVNGVNNPPALLAPLSDLVAADGEAVSLDLSSSFSDPDASALAFDVEGLPPSLSVDESGLITGVLDDVDVGASTVVVTATDEAGASIFDSFSLTVSDIEEAPVFGPIDSPVSVAENQTAVLTATATDPDAGSGPPVFGLAGIDAGLFEIDPSSGELSFIEVPDFESPSDANGDNVFEFEIVAADADNPELSSSQPVTVTLENVAEAPVLFLGDTAPEVPEGETLITAVEANSGAATSAPLLSVAGPDAPLLGIFPTGELRFLEAPDFEEPSDADGDNLFEVTVVATDAGDPTLSSSQDLAIAVTDVAETPVAFEEPTSEPEPLINPEPVVESAPVELEPIVEAEPVIELGPVIELEPVVAEPIVEAEPVIEPEPVIAEPVVEAEPIVDEPVVIAEAPTLATSVFATSVNEGETLVTIFEAVSGGAEDAPVLSLEGPDAGLFEVDELTGEIQFVTVADFENPSDADGDNNFDFTLIATDAGDPSLSTSKVFDVELLDVDVLDLDVDRSGVVDSIDVLNIFRVLAGAPQAIAIQEGLEVTQQEIVDTVSNFPELGLDVDGSGSVEASLDVLNTFRVLAGAPQAVAVAEASEASQQEVVDAVNGLPI